MKYSVYAFDKVHWLMFNPETGRYLYTLHTIENLIQWTTVTSPAYGQSTPPCDPLTFLFEFDPDDYPEYRI